MKPSCCLLIVCVMMLATCSTPPEAVVQRTRLKANAVQAPGGVKVDGRLDDPVWSTCPSYALSLSQPDQEAGPDLQEAGTFQIAWDDQWLYIAVNFEDSDVIAEGDVDQLHHYNLGDVAEVFIKPADQTWYWELYAVPNGLKSAFFYPGRGRLPLPSNFEYESGLRVAAVIDGSLNNWRDRDRGWTAEMAIPLKELAVNGIPPNIDDLTVLVARFNYSRYLVLREQSAWPTLEVNDNHWHKGYGQLSSDD